MNENLKRDTEILKLDNKIVEYGSYNDTFEQLLDYLRADSSGTIVLCGKQGCGKKTVVKKVIEYIENNEKLNVLHIELDPVKFHDDFSAIKHIGNCFKIGSSSSVGDITEEIIHLQDDYDKIIIVLKDFHVFCQGRQSLMYNVTELCQKKKVKVIGLTCHLTSLEALEKRVRSRMNAKVTWMSYPYANKNEYVEFASLLLEGYKFDGDVVEELEFQYLDKTRDMTTLKRWLRPRCEWSQKNNKLSVKNVEIKDSWSLRQMLSELPKNQLELLKLAIHYCQKHDNFTISQLIRDQKPLHKKIDLKEKQTIIDLINLSKVGLIRLVKSNTPSITRTTAFCPNISIKAFNQTGFNKKEVRLTQSRLIKM